MRHLLFPVGSPRLGRRVAVVLSIAVAAAVALVVGVAVTVAGSRGADPPAHPLPERSDRVGSAADPTGSAPDPAGPSGSDGAADPGGPAGSRASTGTDRHRLPDGPCGEILAAWAALAGIDPHRPAEAAGPVGRVRALLPPELRASFDRWWVSVRADPAGTAVRSSPEIDAWFARTCP